MAHHDFQEMFSSAGMLEEQVERVLEHFHAYAEAADLTEHHEIVELIGRGQPDAAVRAMQAHLDRSNRLYAHRNGPSVSPG